MSYRASPFIRAFVCGALASLVAVAASGCGDLYSDPVSIVVDGVDSSVDPPTFDAAATVPRDFVVACPAMAIEGAGCDLTGQTCEYGSSPDTRCNTTLACMPSSVGAIWTARPSILCPSYACPASTATIDTVDGTACALPTADASAPPTDADELLCPMSDGVCACTTGVDAAHAHARRWVCVKPETGCPANRPLAGAFCPVQRICDYGSCAFKRGLRMDCDGEAWRSEGAACN